ncbi:hypothetical protein OBB02_04270, partial [Candidatus Puniceispirillum sp.]|nr:hypothetical protein [Candidatus Puniceispirillum sp.]
MTSHLPQFQLSVKLLIACIHAFGAVALIPAITSSAFAQTADKARAADTSPITIEAAEFLEWNQNEGTYIAKGKAFVQQSETSIKAGHIIARYDTSGQTRNINRVIATGEVTYVEGENIAKGDKL